MRKHFYIVACLLGGSLLVVSAYADNIEKGNPFTPSKLAVTGILDTEWIEIGQGEDKRISVSLTADGTSEKTNHKAFIRNELTHVPSVSETTADGGVVIFKPGDGLNKIEFSVSATPMTVRVYDDKTCVLCAKIIKLAPNVKVPTGLFVNSAISKELKGASTFSVSKPFSGTISIGRSKDEYIVAGKNGAVLRKEGQGFRLMEGEAFLIVLGE